MNAILEQINSAGSVFVRFALPMLVQSSVLIVVLLIADLLLRKKVRAVVRYWLWMLVLIKLVLPTTLSSPVSLGTWFGDKLAGIKVSETSIVAQPVNLPQIIDTKTTTTTGTLHPDVRPIMISPSITEPVVAQTSLAPLTWQGIVFLVWTAVVIVMGLLLLQRAVFVTGLIAQAQNPTQLMNDAFRFCCGQMGIKGKVDLKVSTNTASPAVCGLFRPVILVPQNLAQTLGSSRLRMVLLHELAHIRRGDLWLNLIQTILQIIYFYNPLLWLANSIIRRIREQAVDEAVQVAMGANATQYPQTLVDVAKIAFNRPVLSLRLIGVVESKSALKGRIERMLNRPIPKSAKLGILGLITLLIFAVVLLPMAKAAEGKKGKVEDAVQFTAKLDNGITVELVGVCDYPKGEARCWRPDGSKSQKLIYAVKWNKENPQADEFGIMLKLNGPEDLSFAWNEIDGAEGYEGSCRVIDDQGNQLKDFKAAIAKMAKGKKTKTTVRIGIATEPWRTEAAHSGRGMTTTGDKDILFSQAFETNSFVGITVSSQWRKDSAQRIVAIDNNDQTHTTGNIGSVASGEIDQMTAKFHGLKLKDIAEFQFQTRPYQWVTFDNVSLKPGVKTDVHVDVEEQAVRNSVPRVVSTTPVVFDDAVSSELSKITVTFDQPMMDKSWSWVRWDAPYPETVGSPYYDDEKKTCTLPVKLEPGKAYLVAFNLEPYTGFVNTTGEPAESYVLVFATKGKDGKPTPIPEELITKAKSINERAETPYTQEVFNDIQPDGTILFRNTTGQINRSGKKVTTDGFINSDFVHVTNMSDAKGRPLKFTSMHEEDIYRYEVTFNEPVLPGELIEYTSEGTMKGLVKPAPDTQNTFKYFMRHWPAAGQPTLRIETYLLPAGAELISTTPEDMQRRTKDGRIELHVEKMIPTGGSITTAFQYRLTGVEGASKVSDKDKMASENLAAKGWELWRQRKLPEAEDAFEKAVSKDPTNANAWNGLGWAQQNQGKPLNAKASFEKCLEIQPKHAAALNGLGWIAKVQGKTDEAIAHWEKAIEAAPNATAALNGLATTYMELKQFDKAAKYYKMWLKVEPDNPDAKAGLQKAKSQKTNVQVETEGAGKVTDKGEKPK
jgi:bla regulator protein BlaR1